MPIEVKWYIPYKVLEARAWGVLTIEDIQQWSQLCVEFLTEAQPHLSKTLPHNLVDTTETVSMPPVYRMMTQALPVLRFKRGTMFHITKNKMMRSLMELTAHVTKFKLRTFATREEAIRALEVVLLEEGFNLNKGG